MRSDEIVFAFTIGSIRSEARINGLGAVAFVSLGPYKHAAALGKSTASVVQRQLAEIQVVGKKTFNPIEHAVDTKIIPNFPHAPAEEDLKP